MPKLTPIQTNFTGGEISPKLYGRVDLDKYVSSVKRSENFVFFPHGGITKRSGTKYIATVKNSAHNTRLIPFVFSTIQAYIVEFGDQYVRFFKDEGQVVNGGSAYEIATPYSHGEVFDIQFTQSADVLYLFHPNYQPRKLSRTSHTSWTLTALNNIDGPYGNLNTTTTTLTAGAKTGNTSITASAITGINNGQGFLTTDVGRCIRLQHGTKWGSAKITSRSSTTVVNVTVETDFPFDQTTGTSEWRLGAWSDTTGWPTTGGFFEERFFAANTATQPNTVFSSVSGDFETFSPTNTNSEVLDDSALNFTLASDQVNAIRWLYGSKNLELGTSDGPFLMSSGRDDLALTPTNVKVVRETTDGCSTAKPVGASKATVFIDRSRLKLRELAYSIEQDGFTTPDLTIIAEHILAGFVEELSFTRTPDRLMWARLADGGLRCLTYEREQDVIAWGRHVIAGTNAKVKSIAAIPSPDESEDQLYMVVERTINGATVKYVEFLERLFSQDRGDTLNDSYFVDSGLGYSGSAITTVTGLGHLEGETVACIVNGTTHPNKTVSSGEITLDRAATTLQVGLPYVAKITTLDPEVQTEEGTSQGKMRRVERLTFRLVDTFGLKVGTSETNLENVLFRTPAMPMGQVDLFTGDKRILLSNSPDRELELHVQHDLAMPCTILAIMYSLVVSER